MQPSTQSSTDTAASFREQGYCLAPGVFAPADVAALEADFDRIVEQLHDSGGDVNARWRAAGTDALDGGASVVVHTHNPQRYSARWLQALMDPRFLDVAEAILGPDIVLHHSKLFMKPPREGSPFPIHQDWWYFPTCQDSMVAAIIFLTDAGADSGGVRVYPGSQRLGRLPDSSGLAASESLRDYPLEDATPIDASAGDVLFFSYFTLHGSTPNRSAHSRKTVLAQLYSGTDRLEPEQHIEHVDERLVLRGWNHHMNRERAAE